jgi:hypothetical protein
VIPDAPNVTYHAASISLKLRCVIFSNEHITSSVKVSMPQFVWWITNHSFVPSSLSSGCHHRWRDPFIKG